jgi:DtxR family Mn-dependent transcriptional regulator
MSESLEMYLVMTALLRTDAQQPVPVSLLASRLAVTPVSANEMCHKLSERGLVAYQPYKGVTLTETGEALAQQILTRRRLWVVFLVENLGIEPQEADDLACQLEHITSERLVAALKAFLERAPAARPARADIQRADHLPPTQPLSSCTAGTRGQIAGISAEPVLTAFLRAQGIVPGVPAELLVVSSNGAVLLGIADQQVALAPAVAAQITIAAVGPEHAARHQAWARCSAFWDCLRGEACACELHPPN